MRSTRTRTARARARAQAGLHKPCACRKGDWAITKLTLTPSSWCSPKTERSPWGKGVPVTHHTRRARSRSCSRVLIAPPPRVRVRVRGRVRGRVRVRVRVRVRARARVRARVSRR